MAEQTRIKVCVLCSVVLLLGGATVAQAAPATTSPPGPSVFKPGFLAATSKDSSRRDQERGVARHAAQRRRSRTAYRDLTSRQSYALGARSFGVPSPLRAAEPLPGVRRIKALSQTSQLVMDANGKKSVMVSSTPLTVGRGDTARPLDLTLNRQDEGFEPEASNTPITISSSLADGVSFPTANFAVSLRSSSRANPIVSSGSAFWANASQDVDYQVLPAPTGAESFLNLRSREAAESFRFDVRLPKGATVKRAVSPNPIPNDPPRSLVIMGADGTPLGYINPASAVDADGTNVPATLRPVADGFAIDIEHKSADVRYPIQVDPLISVYGANSDWAGWTWGQVRTNAYAAQGYPDSYFGMAVNDCNYYCGLYQSMPTNSTFSPGSYAQFTFTAPANTYIAEEAFGYWGHQPFYSASYNGIYDPYAGNWAANTSYVNASGGTGGNPWSGTFGVTNAQHTYCRSAGGTATNPTCDLANRPPSDGNIAVQGLRVDGPYVIFTTSNRATSYMQYAYTFLSDRYAPAIASAVPASTGWANDNATTALSVSLSDAGLGLKSVTLTGAASGGGTITNGCSGDPYRSACPKTNTTPFSYTLAQGVNTLSLRTTDVAGNYSASQTWTRRIDRTAPSSATITGQLAGLNGRAVNGSYSLTATGTDQYSGIRRLELLVDGQPVDASMPGTQVATQGDPGTGGGMSRPLTFDTTNVSEGSHSVTVQATDGVGLTRNSATVTVTVDRTAPAVALTGSMKDASGSTIEEGGTLDLVMGVDDGAGRSGVSRVDLKLDGNPVTDNVPDGINSDLCTSGSCPRTVNATYSLDVDALALGQHSVTVSTIDQVGNRSPTQTVTFQITESTAASDPSVTYEHDDLAPDSDDAAPDDSVDLGPDYPDCVPDAAEDCSGPSDLSRPDSDSGVASRGASSAAGPGPASSLQAHGPGWGMAFENAGVFGEADFQEVDPPQVRKIVPWDIAVRPFKRTACSEATTQEQSAREAYARQLYENLKRWVASARAQNREITISFGRCANGDDKGRRPSEYGTLPSQAEYRAAFLRFMQNRNFKGIRWYTAWNEPNSDGQPTSAKKAGSISTGAGAAAKFYMAFRDICARPTRDCTVAAGEFVDGTEWASGAYFRSYRQQLTGRQPTVWAFHPYVAANGTGGAARRFKAFLDRVTTGSNPPKVWITEAGGIKRSRAFPNQTEAQATQATQKLITDLPALNDQITRLYLYSLHGDYSVAPDILFDSGLLAPTPPGGGPEPRRPQFNSFKALASR